MSPPVEAERKREFTCPQCGRNAVFTPGEGLKCPSCGHAKAIAQTAEQIEEFSLEEYLRNRAPVAPPSGQKSIKCKSCGAETTVPADAATMACAFCGNEMVLEAAALPAQLQPEAVVPFQIDKEKSRQLLDAWIKSRWFAPNALRKLAAQDKVVGVYRPYWTFDSDTTSWYRGERGDYYYEKEEYTDAQGNKQTREVRRTRWTSVSGRVARFFDDVLVPAGRPTEWSTSYDLRGARPYAPEFLAGWSAERYTVAPEQGWDSARAVMDAKIRSDVTADIGGDEQRVHDIRTSYNAVRFKHVLLPLWLGTYRYANRAYRVQVNGQSGEVRGQRPYSFWKIFFLIVGIAAAVTALMLLSLLFTRDGAPSGFRNPPLQRTGPTAAMKSGKPEPEMRSRSSIQPLRPSRARNPSSHGSRGVRSWPEAPWASESRSFSRRSAWRSGSPRWRLGPTRSAWARPSGGSSRSPRSA